MTIQYSEKSQINDDTQEKESPDFQSVQNPEIVENSQKRSSSNPQTPEQNQQFQKNSQNENLIFAENDKQQSQINNTQGSQVSINKNVNQQNKQKMKAVGTQANKKNFYNPPGKVIKQLNQQSYNDNNQGNNGQFYSLKQKYKTQLCKHFMEYQTCPLAQYCQFAHGNQELRQPNDSLPQNFGKIALGAVHSNYKTNPCKYWEVSGECKFGVSCSYYHGESEKRKLIDPIPNLPEGVNLPPMPKKLQQYNNKNQNNYQHNQRYNNYYDYPQNNYIQQQNILQMTTIADIVANGGFNPNKYMTSPIPVQPFPLNFQQGNYNYGQSQQFYNQYPLQHNQVQNVNNNTN